METWKKVGLALGALALAGGAGRHVEDAQKDPDHIYGPAQFGDDVGRGVDRVAGGVGDAAGGAIGGSDVAKAAAAGAGGYGAYKGGKAWANRDKNDELHANVDDSLSPTTTEPVMTEPTLLPMPEVGP